MSQSDITTALCANIISPEGLNRQLQMDNMDAQPDTISLLPDEVLEMFALYLPPQTITALKRVDKRFNAIFNSNKCWERYLYFDKKYYKCDLLSNFMAGELENVREEINEENVETYKGYYMLQHAHLENWVSGRNQFYNEILLKPHNFSRMEEMVDDHNHNHYLFFSADSMIYIWNITEEPIALPPVNVSTHCGMRLLPQGKMFTFDRNNGLINVYHFDHFDLNLQYQFVYFMDGVLNQNMQPQMRFLLNFRFIVMKTFFIGYDCAATSLLEMLLHIWDLELDIKKATINLSEYDVTQSFVEFVMISTRNRVDISASSYGCRLNLYPGTFPNVVLVLSHPQERLSQVNIFNVETLQFTHLVDQLSTVLVNCYVYFNKVCIQELVYPDHDRNMLAAIYVVPHQSNTNIITCDRRARYVTCPPPLSPAGTNPRYEYNNIAFIKSKALIKTLSEVHIIHLDSDNLHETQIGVASSYSILGFIEPKLLLMYDLHKSPNSTTVKVYNVLSGLELCSWEAINTTPDRFMYYFRNLEYPSKVVLSVEYEQKLRVYNF